MVYDPNHRADSLLTSQLCPGRWDPCLHHHHGHETGQAGALQMVSLARVEQERSQERNSGEDVGICMVWHGCDDSGADSGVVFLLFVDYFGWGRALGGTN